MEYRKIINLLDNIPNEPCKSRTKKWVGINDCLHRTYNANSQIKLKTSMPKSSLCNYSDAHILVKGTITITGNTGAPAERIEVQIKNDKTRKEIKK